MDIRALKLKFFRSGSGRRVDAWRELRSWRPFLLLFLSVAIIYGQTLFFGFTYFDDQALVIDRSAFLEDWHNIPAAFSQDAFSSAPAARYYYRPLLTLSLMMDAQLAGTSPAFFHLTNIAIHFLAVSLLFLVLERLGSSRRTAFLLSLLFAVQPALTAAVAWIPGRNDSLAAVFILASFLSALYFLEKGRGRYLALSLALFFLALMTKETAIVFPFLLGLYVLSNRRFRREAAESWLAAGLFATVILIWYFFRSYALSGSAGVSGSDLLGWFSGWPDLFVSLGKLVLPFKLSVLPSLAAASPVFGILALLILTAAIFLPKRRPSSLAGFGAIWFLAFLLPTWLRVGSAPGWLEHRLYLPAIGFVIFLSGLPAVKDLDFRRRPVRLVSGAVLALFAVLTVIHARPFASPLSFWERAAADSPDLELAQRNLGAMYYLAGRLPEAEARDKQALALDPSAPMVHNNLGLIYQAQGDYKRAEKEFLQELAIYPDYENARLNLSRLYLLPASASSSPAGFQGLP